MSLRDQAPSALVGRLRAGRFPNALILTGDARQESARWLSMAYLCNKNPVPCGTCAHCRKALAGIHPDVTALGAEGENLKIEALRALRREAYIRPNEAERKVFLLRADAMSLAGQNVLLKVLEEGPAYAAFFLIAAAPEALLPTVRSRCEHVFWQGAEGERSYTEDAQAFADFLKEAEPGLRLMEFLVRLEGKRREELRAMLEECRALLLPFAAEEGANAARILGRLEALAAVRAAAESNISAGHLAGMLMAKLL